MSKVKSTLEILNDAKKLKRASMALEELLWAFKGAKFDSLLDAAQLLSVLGTQNAPESQIVKSYQSEDPNKHFLIGVLPRLFQDRKLFPVNEDIVEFASTALRLNMSGSRYEKRSRYEIIGKVICETDSLDEQQLTDLVIALEVLLNNRDKLDLMAEKKKLGSFSWNETIQELLVGR